MSRRRKNIDDGEDSSDLSSDEEERLAFDVTDADKLDEQNYFDDPNARSKRRKMTRDQHTYGVWADSDSDDDRTKRQRGQASSLTGNVSFVKGEAKASIQNASVEEEQDENDRTEEYGEDESKTETDTLLDTDTRRTGLGFGTKPHGDEDYNRRGISSGSRAGLGSGEERVQGSPISFRAGLGSSEERVQGSPTSFRAGLGSSEERVQDSPVSFASTKKNSRPSSSAPGRSSQQQRKAQPPPVVDKNFGKWEKHTKGFGLQMLMKMGYKPGEGLGSEKEGIVGPIEQKQRPKGKGLGHGGFKEKTEQALREERRRQGDLSPEPEAIQKPAKRVDDWKRSSGPRKAKVEYKTAEEVVSETTEAPQTQSMKIIDMTGKNSREVTSASLATASDITPSASEHLPELRHNLRLLIDLSKHDLEKLTRDRNFQNSRAVALKREQEHLNEITARETRKERRLADLLLLTEAIEIASSEATSSSPPSLEVLREPLRTLSIEFAHEVEQYALDGLVVGAIAPAVKVLLKSWDPLEDPTFAVEHFTEWRNLLKTGEDMEPQRKSGKSVDGLALAFEKFNTATHMTPYESLMYTVWLPRVRSSINNNWDPTSYDPAITLLETWTTPLLPTFIYENILEQLIIPKLMKRVDSWDPRRDRSSSELIHHWLHPWLPILGNRLTSLFSPIRHKFAVALKDAKIMETEGLAMLLPWRKVFQTKDMHNLVDKVVLPNLTRTMRAYFIVNPRNQDLAAFKAVLPWYQLSSTKSFSDLLDQEFFPKWLRALHAWLTAKGDYGEITEWYGAWKSLFPVDVLEMPSVKGGFKRALDMLNQSLERGGEIPHPDEALGTASTGILPKPSSASVAASRITFRDLLEEFAQTHSQLFLPSQRIHPATGKPLFRFGGNPPTGSGGLWLYLDGDVVFALSSGAAAAGGDVDVDSEGGRWVPVDFEGLLGLLEAKRKRR